MSANDRDKIAALVLADFTASVLNREPLNTFAHRMLVESRERVEAALTKQNPEIPCTIKATTELIDFEALRISAVHHLLRDIRQARETRTGFPPN
jgi:hypothetical protein